MRTLYDRSFKYTSAEDSLKPNYLRNRFNALRRELREREQAQKAAEEAAASEQVAKVRRIAK